MSSSAPSTHFKDFLPFGDSFYRKSNLIFCKRFFRKFWSLGKPLKPLILQTTIIGMHWFHKQLKKIFNVAIPERLMQLIAKKNC